MTRWFAAQRRCRIAVWLAVVLAGCAKDLQPDADWPLSKNGYPLTILAMSFSDVPGDRPTDTARAGVIHGRDRRERAAELVRHLRAQEGLAAFYAHDAGPKKTWSAVFVGGYNRADEHAAQRDLEQTKRVIRKLFGQESAPVSRLDRYMEQTLTHRPQVMVVPNRLVTSTDERPAAEKVAPPGYNRGPYNIYECPGRYTLRVKVLAGATAVWLGGQPPPKVPSRLKEAEAMAEALAAVLRKQNHQAYTWHSPRASAVCVGSFDHPKDPRIATVRQGLANKKITLKHKGRHAAVVLDRRPRLMLVPKL